jgi:excisionase family DNA binding protein
MQEEYISRAAAADRLGISTTTLDRRTKSGVIPAYRSGREIVFRTEDIQAAKAAKVPVRIHELKEVGPGKWRVKGTVESLIEQRDQQAAAQVAK